MGAEAGTLVVPGSLSGEELGAELVRFRHAIDLMELRFSLLAAEFAKTDEYDNQGSVSPIDWMRFNCAMTSNAAADRITVGDHVGDLPESLDALGAGRIGFAHLCVMARTADAVGRAFDETMLLEQACDNSPGKFHHVCRHYRHAADPLGFNTEAAEQVDNRHLSLSRWEDGSLILNGVLDSVGGAMLRAALEPLARRNGAHDDRVRERRLADALVELADRGQQSQLQVTSSVETLLGLSGAPAAEMEFTLPVSAQTVERLACDCTVTRVLLDSESVVIDVGRAKRIVSGPARRALNARDGQCTWPGCDRPATWSAAHHVVHWVHGGTTDLDNLILLCHRHHYMVHEGGWQLIKSGDGRMLTIPPTVSFGSNHGPPPADQ